ncbi:hypothetical protein AWB81_01881 [Caballeronia arationis]|uniref:hypothetical protein n=1 Tax=Caballeronia arationis TaxID=1777142 RepID=UPI00074CDBC8|nr:hypothetical protein [Caballeronia arationis]SAK59698.1 hypothetical protein AWB81_01881 [Caballeronia arationis]
MNLEEAALIVKSGGLDERDTASWLRKYRGHRSSARQRGMTSALTFDQYVKKVVEARIVQPSQIGGKQGRSVLGREGDVGPYTERSCRFITLEQNVAEAKANGRYVERNEILSRKTSERMTGLTKDNSDQVRRMSETKTGRTKLNDPARASQADKLARNFELIDPSGIRHTGRNVKDFCIANRLNAFAIYDVFAGRRKHHRGWTGRYID